MPWNVLKYEDRSLKENLSDVFDVSAGIPTLVLLTSERQFIATIANITHGADFFPWDKEGMKSGPAHKIKRILGEEERRQEAAGKIVVRRHIGVCDVVIGVDHVIKFNNFATAHKFEVEIRINRNGF